MTFTNALTLISGLGLFLFGMKIMSDGLELAAGSRLRRMLEIITSKRIVGVMVGLVVTAIIQSSSATTVMVVGFVNAGLMSIAQSVGVIMGANVGTTATSWLVALNPKQIAPFALIAGVIMVSFFRKKTINHVGLIFTGLGMLFLGLDLMSSGLHPLREYQPFINMMVSFGKNPILGVLAGMLVTTVVQSSSASVAILQTLAMQGIVDYRTSMFVLFGQNIGTCVTALLASLGTNKNAKRAAVIHLLFNLIGTVIFVMLIWVSMSAGMPFFSDFIESLTDNPSVRIALTHLVFNVTTTVMLFPFGNLLVKLSGKIVPGQDKDSGEMKLKYLDDNTLKTPMIAAAQVLREVIRMADTVKANLETSLRALGTHNQELAREVYAREKLINFLNHAITAYLVKINTLDLEPRDVRMVSALYHVINDLERIGDHAENIADDVIHCLTYRFELMPDQLEEINRMGKDATEMFDLALDMFGRQKYEQSKADEIEVKEKQVDETKLRLRRRNIEGLTAGEYSAEQGVVFVRVVSNLERVADHATNIAYSLNEHDHPLDPYTKASI